MGNLKEKYLSEAMLSQDPKKKLALKIADGAVTTPKIAGGAVTTEKLADDAVTPEKLSERVIEEVIKPAVDEGIEQSEVLPEKVAELEERVETLEECCEEVKGSTKLFQVSWADDAFKSKYHVTIVPSVVKEKGGRIRVFIDKGYQYWPSGGDNVLNNLAVQLTGQYDRDKEGWNGWKFNRFEDEIPDSVNAKQGKIGFFVDVKNVKSDLVFSGRIDKIVYRRINIIKTIDAGAGTISGPDTFRVYSSDDNFGGNYNWNTTINTGYSIADAKVYAGDVDISTIPGVNVFDTTKTHITLRPSYINSIFPNPPANLNAGTYDDTYTLEIRYNTNANYSTIAVGSINGGTASVTSGVADGNFTTVITPDSQHKLGDATIVVKDNKGNNIPYSYNPANGTLEIPGTYTGGSITVTVSLALGSVEYYIEVYQNINGAERRCVSLEGTCTIHSKFIKSITMNDGTFVGSFETLRPYYFLGGYMDDTEGFPSNAWNPSTNTITINSVEGPFSILIKYNELPTYYISTLPLDAVVVSSKMGHISDITPKKIGLKSKEGYTLIGATATGSLFTKGAAFVDSTSDEYDKEIVIPTSIANENLGADLTANITAVAVQPDTYTLSIVKTGSGNVTYSPSDPTSSSIASGTLVEFNINPSNSTINSVVVKMGNTNISATAVTTVGTAKKVRVTVTDNVVVTVNSTVEYGTITVSPVHATVSNVSGKANGNFQTSVTPDSGYTLTGATVTCSVSALTATLTNGILKVTGTSFSNATVTIEAKKIVPTYSVLRTFDSRVTSNKSNATVSQGSAQNETLSWSEGYERKTVTVTMGGTDITSTAFNTTTNVVNIANVTGNIAITASSQAIAPVGGNIEVFSAGGTPSPAIGTVGNDGRFTATITPKTVGEYTFTKDAAILVVDSEGKYNAAGMFNGTFTTPDGSRSGVYDPWVDTGAAVISYNDDTGVVTLSNLSSSLNYKVYVCLCYPNNWTGAVSTHAIYVENSEFDPDYAEVMSGQNESFHVDVVTDEGYLDINADTPAGQETSGIIRKSLLLDAYYCNGANSSVVLADRKAVNGPNPRVLDYDWNYMDLSGSMESSRPAAVVMIGHPRVLDPTIEDSYIELKVSPIGNSADQYTMKLIQGNTITVEPYEHYTLEGSSLIPNPAYNVTTGSAADYNSIRLEAAQEAIRDCLTYNPQTGVISCKKSLMWTSDIGKKMLRMRPADNSIFVSIMLNVDTSNPPENEVVKTYYRPDMSTISPIYRMRKLDNFAVEENTDGSWIGYWGDSGLDHSVPVGHGETYEWKNERPYTEEDWILDSSKGTNGIAVKDRFGNAIPFSYDPTQTPTTHGVLTIQNVTDTLYVQMYTKPDSESGRAFFNLVHRGRGIGTDERVAFTDAVIGESWSHDFTDSTSGEILQVEVCMDNAGNNFANEISFENGVLTIDNVTGRIWGSIKYES